MSKIKYLNKTRTKFLFLKFLKKEKILDEFNKEFYKSNWNRGYVSIVHYLNLRYMDFINDAFLWDETSKGFDFWKNINNKWFLYLHEDYEKTARKPTVKTV